MQDLAVPIWCSLAGTGADLLCRLLQQATETAAAEAKQEEQDAVKAENQSPAEAVPATAWEWESVSIPMGWRPLPLIKVGCHSDLMLTLCYTQSWGPSSEVQQTPGQGFMQLPWDAKQQRIS